MKFTSFLLNFSFFILSFGQLARIAWPDFPVFMYLFEPILAVVTVFLLISTRASWTSSSLAKSALIFLGVMGVTLLVSIFRYSGSDNIVALLYFGRLSMYIVFIVSLLEYTSLNKLNTAGKYGLGATTFFIILSSIVQYIWYPNLGNLAYLGWDPHLYRVVGLFFDPPLTVSVFVLLILHFSTIPIKRRWFVRIFVIVPLLILSLLTYSRGGYIGILAVIGTYVISRKQLKLYILVGLCLIAAYFVIPRGASEGINLLRTTSINARFDDYQKAISIWEKHPLMGIGYNHIRPEKDPFEKDEYSGPFNPSHGSASFHSSFLIILVTGGIAGLMAWGYLLFTLARRSQFLMYAVIYLSVISLFDNVLLHPIPLFLVGYLGSKKANKKK